MSTNIDGVGVSQFGMKVGPEVLATTGKHIYVHHTGSALSNGINPAMPVIPTLDAAVGKCRANKGDVIILLPGHAETIATATALALDVAGITVVNMSQTNPAMFSLSATDSTIAVSAGNVRVLGEPIVKATINNVAAGFTISAADVELNVETRDTSATVEFISSFVTTAAADRLKIKAKHVGFLAGAVGTRYIDLVGANTATIDVDYFGVSSTAVVNMRTTASDNVRVTGKFHNGVTNLTKDVVDTVGTSTWSVEGFDVVAGASFSGGSGAPVAVDDVSALATSASLATLQAEVSGAAGLVTFPVGAAAGNTVSIAEVLRFTQENVINGTGTALPTNDSLYGVLAGASGITTFPAAALPANNVSIAEVLREAYDQQDKAVTNTTATLVNATTLFTIAGGPIEILSLVSRCVTGNDATASTLQYNADPTDGVAVTISAASASLANVAAGGLVTFQGTTLATAPLVSASGANIAQAVTNGVVVGAGIITSVVGVGSTTGTWQTHMRYRPLARGVTVS